MASIIYAERYHDFSIGHRVVGHETCCAFLHGHNLRVHFTCAPADGMLDSVGRVIDFADIKKRLCSWLEDAWDHKFLLWTADPMLLVLQKMARTTAPTVAGSNFDEFFDAQDLLIKSLVPVPFNPTSENIAKFLLEEIGPAVLIGTGITLIKVRVEETRKCSVVISL